MSLTMFELLYLRVSAEYTVWVEGSDRRGGHINTKVEPVGLYLVLTKLIGHKPGKWPKWLPDPWFSVFDHFKPKTSRYGALGAKIIFVGGYTGKRIFFVIRRF